MANKSSKSTSILIDVFPTNPVQKERLQNQWLSIAEVAYSLGFTHQSHFSHHFKRLVGSSPKAFLNNQ